MVKQGVVIPLIQLRVFRGSLEVLRIVQVVWSEELFEQLMASETALFIPIAPRAGNTPFPTKCGLSVVTAMTSPRRFRWPSRVFSVALGILGVRRLTVLSILLEVSVVLHLQRVTLPVPPAAWVLLLLRNRLLVPNRPLLLLATVWTVLRTKVGTLNSPLPPLIGSAKRPYFVTLTSWFGVTFVLLNRACRGPLVWPGRPGSENSEIRMVRFGTWVPDVPPRPLPFSIKRVALLVLRISRDLLKWAKHFTRHRKPL